MESLVWLPVRISIPERMMGLVPLVVVEEFRGEASVFSRSPGVFLSDGLLLVAVAAGWLPPGEADLRPTGVRLPDDFLSWLLSLALALSCKLTLCTLAFEVGLSSADDFLVTTLVS